MDLRSRIKSAAAVAREGRYDEAVSALEKLTTEVGNCPEAAPIWASLAYVHKRKGDIHQALQHISTAISLLDKEPAHFFKRGRYLFELGRYVESEADFTKVLQLCDQYQSDYYRSAAHFARADARLKQRKYTEAMEDLNHIPDDDAMWTDHLRTKAEMLAECSRKGS